MIKIQNDIPKHSNDPLAEVYNDYAVHEILRGKGIDIGRHCHPDYVIAMANDIVEPKENTIGIERIDGCQIRNHKLLRHPNLKRLVKMYSYESSAISNLSCVDGRIFTRHLTDERPYPKNTVSNEDFSKIALGCNFLHYKRHDKIDLFIRNHYFQEKPIDVFFAGTVEYKGKNKSRDLVSEHRRSCVESLKKLQKKYCMVVADSKMFPSSEYIMSMAKSKLTVSPWGWGEACYRDYEGLISRMDVIKPKSYKVFSQADIYSNTVFYCKPDFSNLEKVIDNCLETFEKRKNEREQTSRRLLQWRTPEAVAGIIESIIRSIND